MPVVMNFIMAALFGFLYMVLRGYEVKLISREADQYMQFGWSFVTAMVNGFLIYNIAQEPVAVPFYALGWALGAVVANKLPFKP